MILDRVRGWFTDAIFFACAVGVYLLLSQVVPNDKSLWLEVLSQSATAFVSGLLVIIAVDVALGRPNICLDWVINSQPPVSRQPEIHLKPPLGATVRVNISSERNSLFARVLRLCSRRLNLNVTVHFTPRGLVTLTGQNVPPGVRVSDDQVTFDLFPIAGQGRFNWVELSVTTTQSTVTLESVECRMVANFGSKVAWIANRLVGRDAGLEAMTIRRT